MVARCELLGAGKADDGAGTAAPVCAHGVGAGGVCVRRTGERWKG